MEFVRRLRDAAENGGMTREWATKAGRPPVRGTVIMRYVWRTKELHKGLGSWFLLFSHCTLKSPPEAVVEGYGGVLDKHCNPRRGVRHNAHAQHQCI